MRFTYLNFIILFFIEFVIADVIHPVSIRHRGEHRCSGVLVDEKFVLTPASCVCRSEMTKPKIVLEVAIAIEWNVIVEKQNVSIVYCHDKHENFQPYGAVNDIALLKIDHVKEVSSIPVKLLTIDDSPSKEKNCKLYVWENNKIRIVRGIRLYARKICEKWMYKYVLEHDALCSLSAAFKVHPGDEGSPLVCKEKLVGLFSWQYPKLKQTQLSPRPYIFTNVAAHRQFIDGVRSNEITIIPQPESERNKKFYVKYYN